MNSDSNQAGASNTFSGFLRRTDAKRSNVKRNRATMLGDGSGASDREGNRVKNNNLEASSLASLPSDSSVVFDEEATALAASSVSESLSSQLPNRGNSPQPSQFSLTQGSSLLLASQPVYLPRQRPRFHTVQDLDVALNQAIEGKINSKNAWVSKEASDLLEGITHTIESTLENNGNTDDYSGFAKAATVVEGCSKVWTIRVDSTYNQSNQMVQRLLRNDENDRSNNNNNNNNGGGDGDGNNNVNGSHDGEDNLNAEDNRRRSRINAKLKTLARTLAMESSEINLDAKAKTALTQAGIKPQFRAIIEKFDQGNAQGLLMYNAPLGHAGNYILDVDYSRVHRTFSARQSRHEQRSQTQSNRSSGLTTVQANSNEKADTYTNTLTSSENTHNDKHLVNINGRGDGVIVGDASNNNNNNNNIFNVDDEELQRKSEVMIQYETASSSSSSAKASKAAHISNMINNLPEYNIAALISERDELFLVPCTRMVSSHSTYNLLTSSTPSLAAALLSSSSSSTTSTTTTTTNNNTLQTSSSSGVGVERQIRGVQFAPATNDEHLNESDLPAASARSSTAVVQEVNISDIHNQPMNNNSVNNITMLNSEQHNNNNNAEDDYYDDDMAGGDNDGDNDWPHDEESNEYQMNRNHTSNDFGLATNDENTNIKDSSRGYYDVSEHDAMSLINEQAHQLVSGVAELSAMDALFPSSVQLALEADDPTSWCPLSEDRLFVTNKNNTNGPHDEMKEALYGYSSHFSNVLLRWAPHSELGKLHKEHHFLSQTRSAANTSLHGLLLSDNKTAANAKGNKRTRKEKTVVFDLPDDLSLVTERQRFQPSVFTLTKEEVKGSSLKQATTMTKNVTAFGKEVFLNSDASHVILRYTQGAFQKQKAESNGLLLPPTPVPGETIPPYTFYPLSTNNFFQPFSTAQSNWNLLRKSAAGSLIESSTRRGFGAQLIAKQNQSVNASRANRAQYYDTDVADDNNINTGAEILEDMPVEFFPAGAERLSSKQLFSEMDVVNEMNGKGVTNNGEYNENNYNDNNNVGDMEANDQDEEYDMGGLGEDFYDAVDHYTEDALRAEEQLLSQFDALHNSNMEAAQQVRVSITNREGSTSHLALGNVLHSQRNSILALQPRSSTSHPVNAEDLINVLKAAEVTIPNQVDVVRLRLTMWEVLRRLLTCNSPPLLKLDVNGLVKSNVVHNYFSSSTATGIKSQPEMQLAQAALTSNATSLLPPKRVMKRHVLAAMARRQQQEKLQKQKLHRQQEEQEEQHSQLESEAKKKNDDEDEEEEEELSMLELFKGKKHAEKVHSRKRHRNAGDDKQSNEETNNGKELEEEEKEDEHLGKKHKHDANTCATKTHKEKTLVLSDNSSDDESNDDNDDDDDDEDDNDKDGQQKINSMHANTHSLTTKRAVVNCLPTFSHVVQMMLPTIASISSSGTLSPAFFFFSILFLANEHNVILESVPTLDDLLVKGVADTSVHQ